MSKKIYYFLCGLAMGTADTIPGVSGGTIAFITGIYEKLLQNITACDRTFFTLLMKGQFRLAMAKISWDFILPLLLGIITAIFSLANLVIYLMEAHLNFVWAFFFGLILASLLLLLRSLFKIPGYNFRSLVLFVVGALFALWLAFSNPIALEHSYIIIFLSGFVAICAMILPGISGAFLLVLLGQYNFILQCVANMELGILALFASGALCGLFSFARLIRWCLEKYYKPCLAFLAGILAGSLAMMFPFTQKPFLLDSENMLLGVFIIIGLVIPIGLAKAQKKFSPQ